MLVAALLLSLLVVAAIGPGGVLETPDCSGGAVWLPTAANALAVTMWWCIARRRGRGDGPE